MDNEIKPVTALVVVTVFLTLFGGGFWAYDQTFDLLSVDYTQRTHWATTVVRTGDLLTEFDDDLDVVREVDITSLGLKYSWGNFLFTDRNTLIVNSLGSGGHDNGVEGSEQAGLYRCDLSQQRCGRFAVDMPVIHRHWFATFDPERAEIFISHVSRDQLFRINKQGQFFEMAVELKQPGVARMSDETLLLMDTNNRRLLQLDASAGGALMSAQVIVASATQRYPQGFVKMGNEWWVNMLADGWLDGAIIRYHANWREMGRLPLPESAKPFLLERLGNGVIVSDYENKRLYQLSAEGQYQGELYSPAMEALLVPARQRSALLMNVVRGCAALAVLFFVIGIVVGISRGDLKSMEKRQKARFGMLVEEGAAIIVPEQGQYWIAKNEKFGRQFKWAMVLMVLVATLFPVILFIEGDLPTLWRSLLLTTMPIPLFFGLWLYRQLQRSIDTMGIAVTKETIILRNTKGEQAEVRPQDLFYNPRSLIAGNVLVSLIGSAQMGYLFDPEDMKKWLMPRLHTSTAIGEMALMKIMWRLRHPQLMVTISISVPVLGFFIYDMLAA